MKASFERYVLKFKTPGGTSRGILKEKETFFIHIWENGKKGTGECGLLRKLSIDDRPDYIEKLHWTCEHIHLELDYLYEELREFPSIQFGLEQAFLDLNAKEHLLFPSDFTCGDAPLRINGLIWMGSVEYMRAQIKEKLKQGFSCLKIKIGNLDFEEELTLLQQLRNKHPELSLRVDANGAFLAEEALERLNRLAALRLHSIEQPIQSNQWDIMADLCRKAHIPIALDEELIGIFDKKEKKECLKRIKPHYIVLKPGLIGGFRGAQEWIELANEQKIGWWITSALESNIGLSALAQWTYTLGNNTPQGLGTGGLYMNNLPSKLQLKGENLFYKMRPLDSFHSLNWLGAKPK